MTSRRDKRMRTLTLLVAAMLAVSLAALGAGMLLRDRRGKAGEAYPDLHVRTEGVFAAPAKPTIYFTFEGGPGPYTEKLLDVLREQRVSATFFVSGPGEDKEESVRLLRRMRDEGHTIGLLRFSHRHELLYASLDNYLKELDALNGFVREAADVRPALIRFPGGGGADPCPPDRMRQIAGEMTRRGYISHDWTVSAGHGGDLPDESAKDIADSVLAGLRGRQLEVIRCQETETAPEAVADLIAELRRQGYAFDRLTEATPSAAVGAF